MLLANHAIHLKKSYSQLSKLKQSIDKEWLELTNKMGIAFHQESAVTHVSLSTWHKTKKQSVHRSTIWSNKIIAIFALFNRCKYLRRKFLYANTGIFSDNWPLSTVIQAYSPDFLPSDYHLFVSFQKRLDGKNVL